MSKVILFRCDGTSQKSLDKTVCQIWEELLPKVINDVGNVVIKPNLNYYWDASTGETTDPRIVSSIIDCVRTKIGQDVQISIVESDASAMKTKYAFKALGYEQIFRTKNVRLINLSKGNVVSKNVKLSSEMCRIKINKILLSADFVINVPTLKIHHGITKFSCALKNFFGLISTPYKYQYHRKLPKYVVAINKLVKPNLIIVDGLVALGKFPKKLNLILGATDPVACDILVSKILGINWRRDPLMSEARREDLGEDSVELIDNEFELRKICKEFPQQNSLTDIVWSLQLKLLRAYAYLSGDIMPPILSEG